MILGTGIDIVEVARIRDMIEKFGDRFLRRILHPAEIAYCQSYREAAPVIAGRFAAKEAIAKAFGTGIGSQLRWHDMEIGRKASGEPFVIWHGAGEQLLQQRAARTIHINLSHTPMHAAAMAILEG